MSKIYNYIKDNFKQGEPIFLSELKVLRYSDTFIRQEVKSLVDKGLLKRIRNGVYIIPYTDILGLEGNMSIRTYIQKKYLQNKDDCIGYITGMQLANEYGFTTQNPASYEVCSNSATTKQRKDNIDKSQIIVYQPVVPINKSNASALQFLDLMLNIDKYSEIKGDSLKVKIKRFISLANVDFNMVKKYLPLYPDRVYKNMYQGGIINELV